MTYDEIKHLTDYRGPYGMVISNGVFQNGSDVFNVLDRDGGGAQTFSIKLVLISNPTQVYWGCYTMLEERTHIALTQMTTTEIKDYVNAMATEKGRTPVGNITAFPNSLSISEAGANFWSFIAGLGLRIEQVVSV